MGNWYMKKEHQYFHRANQLMEQGRFSTAIQLYDAIISINPDFPKIQLHKVNALIKLNKNHEAIIILNQVLQKNPLDVEAFETLQSLQQQKQEDDSHSDFDQSLQINQNFELISSKILQSLELQDDDLISSYSRATQLNPKYLMTSILKANNFFKNHQYSEAISAYDQILQCKPNLSEIYINKGNCLYHLERYEEAISVYDQAASINPLISEAYFNKGNAERKIKNYRQAAESYQKASDSNPSFSKSYVFLGDVFMKLGKYSQAIKAYDCSIQLDLYYADGYTSKAIALIHLNKFREAIINLDMAILCDPYKYLPYYQKAFALEKIGNIQEAIQMYNKVLELKPDFTDVYLYKANGLLKTEKYEEALEFFDNAQQLNPSSSNIYFGKAATLLKLQNSDKAIEQYMQGIKLNVQKIKSEQCIDKVLISMQSSPSNSNPNSIIQTDIQQESIHFGGEIIQHIYSNEIEAFNKGIIYYKNGLFDDAIEAFNEAIKLDSNFVEAFKCKGDIYQKLNKLDEAIICYDHAIELAPNYFEVYINKGVIFQIQGKLHDAILMYAQANNINPSTPIAYYNIGNCLLKLQKYDEAIYAYDQAIELDIDIADIYINKGQALELIGNFEQSLNNYNKGLELNSNHYKGYNSKGNVLAKMIQFEEAIQSYKLSILNNPNYKIAYLNLGDIYIAANNYEEALKTLQEAEKLTSNGNDYLFYRMAEIFENFNQINEAIQCNKKALQIVNDENNMFKIKLQMGRLLQKSGEYIQALEFYTDLIIKTESENPELYYEKGSVLFQLHHYLEAVFTFRKCLNLNLINSEIYLMIGISQRNLNQFDDALESFQEAIKLNQQISLPYILKAQIFEQQGKFTEALKEYNLLTDIQGIQVQKDGKILSSLLGLINHQMDNYNLAKQFYEIVLSNNPGDIEILQSRGILFIQMEQYEEAINEFNKVILINSSNAFAFNNLGLAYYYCKKFEEAQSYFEKAILLNNKFAEAYNNKARVFLEQNQIESADQMIMKTLEINEDFSLGFLNKLCIDIYLRDYSSVLVHLDIIEEILDVLGTNLNEANTKFQRKVVEKIKSIEELIYEIKSGLNQNIKYSQNFLAGFLELEKKNYFLVYSINQEIQKNHNINEEKLKHLKMQKFSEIDDLEKELAKFNLDFEEKIKQQAEEEIYLVQQWFELNKTNDKFKYARSFYLLLLNFFFNEQQIELRILSESNYFGITDKVTLYQQSIKESIQSIVRFAFSEIFNYELKDIKDKVEFVKLYSKEDINQEFILSAIKIGDFKVTNESRKLNSELQKIQKYQRIINFAKQLMKNVSDFDQYFDAIMTITLLLKSYNQMISEDQSISKLIMNIINQQLVKVALVSNYDEFNYLLFIQ